MLPIKNSEHFDSSTKIQFSSLMACHLHIGGTYPICKSFRFSFGGRIPKSLDVSFHSVALTQVPHGTQPQPLPALGSSGLGWPSVPPAWLSRALPPLTQAEGGVRAAPAPQPILHGLLLRKLIPLTTIPEEKEKNQKPTNRRLTKSKRTKCQRVTCSRWWFGVTKGSRPAPCPAHQPWAAHIWPAGVGAVSPVV